jgi:hypothetical protein
MKIQGLKPREFVSYCTQRDVIQDIQSWLHCPNMALCFNMRVFCGEIMSCHGPQSSACPDTEIASIWGERLSNLWRCCKVPLFLRILYKKVLENVGCFFLYTYMFGLFLLVFHIRNVSKYCNCEKNDVLTDLHASGFFNLWRSCF